MRSATYAALCLLASSSVQAAQLAPGCAKKHNSGFHDDPETHSLQSGNWTRNYGIRVPDGYNDHLGKKWPLIVDYHGKNGSPSNQYKVSLFDQYPKGQKYLAVYPAGVEKAWQGPSYAVEGVDDLQFTTDLLAHLRENYCIDDNRIYASGKSNGGGFVDLLACSDNGDEFAAFAMAAAALYTDLEYSGCPKRRAILESHGEKDETIPYHPTGPGSGGPLPDVGEWVGWWGKRDGCDPVKDREVSGDKGGYDVTSYSCRGFCDVVQHYRVYELGHCWPDSTGDSADSKRDDCKDRSLDFTRTVLNFFGGWDLKKAPEN
ncbi:hypothetical protein FQN55_000996 [Onygenales sp. PD_40]|nr:hypothetical protein FQN55_000996 [Onygenales sp. PD_40]